MNDDEVKIIKEVIGRVLQEISTKNAFEFSEVTIMAPPSGPVAEIEKLFGIESDQFKFDVAVKLNQPIEFVTVNITLDGTDDDK